MTPKITVATVPGVVSLFQTSWDHVLKVPNLHPPSPQTLQGSHSLDAVDAWAWHRARKVAIGFGAKMLGRAKGFLTKKPSGQPCPIKLDSRQIETNSISVSFSSLG